jgi:RNA polymerase sigma-70 factor (ECF subfamily)
MLYQLHVQKIFRYVVCRVPSNADAEDVTAEVFVNMVEGLPTYNVTDVPFEAWLYRIAASRVADFYRRSNRRAHEDLSENLHDSTPLPEELIQQNQALDRLRGALRQLPDEYQTILIMRFVERKSHAEVAQLIGKTVPAVRNAQHRALIRLSELLDTDKVRHYLRASHE